MTTLLGRGSSLAASATRAMLLRAGSQNKNVTRTLAVKTVEEDAPHRYQLASAVLVERVARLTSPMHPMEQKMLEMLSQIEIEQSLKNDHELRSEREEAAAEARRKGDTEAFADLSDLTEAGSTLKTAKDREDEWKKERNDFQKQSRETEADKENDVRSTNRCLSRPLRLVVQRRPAPGEPLEWDLPSSVRGEGESMRACAERALVQVGGQSLLRACTVLGNAPHGYYKLTYPKRVQKEVGYRGEKLFLFKAIYVEGAAYGRFEVEKAHLVEDYKWLLREDLEGTLHPKVWKGVKEVLYNEGFQDEEEEAAAKN